MTFEFFFSVQKWARNPFRRAIFGGFGAFGPEKFRGGEIINRGKLSDTYSTDVTSLIRPWKIYPPPKLTPPLN